jgi:CspA family cold shock protein
VVRATVREWHDELGWGVLDSPETPGGCWVHFSMIVTPIVSASPGRVLSEFKTLSPGQVVDLDWETPGQEGFDFMGSSVQP